MMLMGTERASQADRLLDRFDTLTWQEVKKMVTWLVSDAEVQTQLLGDIQKWRGDGVISPGQVKNLENMMRVAISASFHDPDMQNVTATGSMIVQDDRELMPWDAYNPHLLIDNFNEAGFGRGTGPPGSGKTNNACVLIEQWLQDSDRNHIITNIKVPLDGVERLHFVRSDFEFFETVANLGREDRWILTLDEMGTIVDRPHDATTHRAAQVDKLCWVIRKVRGNFLILTQAEASVPRMFNEFSATIFRCFRPGVLNLILKPGFPSSRREAIDIMPKRFPKTNLPFDTYDVGYFKIHPKTVEGILAILERPGLGDFRDAMREFLKDKEGKERKEEEP